MTTLPTLSQLQRGLAISEKIAALKTELAAIFNGSVPTKTPPSAKVAAPPVKAMKGGMSPEGRARVSKPTVELRTAKGANARNSIRPRRTFSK